MYENYGLYIGGEWRKASDGGTYAVIDPATEDVLGQAPAATEADVEAAIAAAEEGLKVWRATQPWARAKSRRGSAWSVTVAVASVSEPCVRS